MSQVLYGVESNLSILSINPFQYIFVCDILKSRLHPSILIILKSLSESLRPVIIGITKWLMDAFQDVTTSHEDSFECRGACPGMSRDKDGVCRHPERYTLYANDRKSIQIVIQG